jgi:uncharacterized protein YwqG
MIDPEHAIAAIRSSRFAHLEEQLAGLLEPSIRIGVQPTGINDLPLGASRFGGLPDMPPGISWPRLDDRPLGLIAQLRLADLTPHDSRQLLPRDGWLCFFFDAVNDMPFETHEAERSWRVLYFDADLGDLQRIEPPEPSEARNRFGACALGFAGQWTLPSFGSVLLEGVPLEASDRSDYEELVFSLHPRAPLPAQQRARPWQRWLGQLQHWWIGDPIHRVFGHPEHFQIDPRVDWQRLSLHRPVVGTPDAETCRAARDWLLLLQLDAYQGGPDWQWGDHGTLYFGIHRDDLAAERFDAVQWTVECG